MKKYTNKKKTAITIAFMGILGLCAVMGMSQKEYKSTYASVEPSTQAVIYNDEQFNITLTAGELNNYTFNNLNSLFVSYQGNDNVLDNIFSSLIYNSGEYELDEGYFDNGHFYINFAYDDYNIGFNGNGFNNKFAFGSIVGSDWVFTDFEYDLLIYIDSTLYDEVKSAIELDIQANQPVSQGDSVISAITSGMGLAPDLANELLKGFTAVFWDTTNSSLTKVSNFMLVMLGIAMVMAIIKLSLSLIRSNTGA